MSTKVNKKSTVTKKQKKALVLAHNERCFWVHHGPILGNLRDLEAALKKISDDQFAYHANAKKNDFAKWVEEVLRDAILAKKLLGSKTRATACKAVADHLKKNY